MKIINYNNEFIFAPGHGLCVEPKDVPGCEDYKPRNPLTPFPEDDEASITSMIQHESEETYPAYEDYEFLWMSDPDQQDDLYTTGKRNILKSFCIFIIFFFFS